MRKVAVLSMLTLVGAAGCGSEVSPGADEDAPPPVTESVVGEDSVNCSSPQKTTGYQLGNPVSIELVTADGKPVEIKTASSYQRMQLAAARDHVNLTVVSGYRSYAEQQYLYGCYIHCNCNSCNLAARPGYSNHEAGHALDLNTSNPGVYSWLEAHAATYGFHRTVPSEIWHWEYWGPLVAGACSGGGGSSGGGGGGGGGGTASKDCFSSTLNKDVSEGTCVQAASDGRWYHCTSGGWAGGDTGCTSSYAWCHSATLNRDVAPRTCVQSASDRVWYQCDHGAWQPGVSNGAGPLGTCSSEHAL